MAGLLALICFGLIGCCYYQSIKVARQLAGRDLAQSFSLRIVERFHESIGPVFMLASHVRKNNGDSSGFDVLAADLIHEFPLLRALELAPGGVVSRVYPLRGNEIVIGHDLLKDKARNKDAHLAVAKRQMSVAGPVELMQGGSAAIARYPIFLQQTNGRSSFWGFSIALVNIPDLLAVAGEMELERMGYDYQICRMAPGAEKCEVFAKRGGGVTENVTTVNIGLPNVNWELTLMPKADWVSMAVKISILMAALLGSLIVAGGVFFIKSRRSDLTIDNGVASESLAE